MDTEKITLKKSPSLEFIFNKHSFQIINKAEPVTEGIYEYSKIESIGYEKEKTNWLLTILSYVVELFAGVGGGAAYKNKKRLIICHTSTKLNFDLMDCEKKTIDKLISRLEIITKTNKELS